MSDRLTEIRARLGVAQDYRVEWPDHKPGTLAEFIAHAPADIAWLLRRLDFATRLAADLEAQLNRAHERHAAEVERLRRNETVALDVTKLVPWEDAR